MQCVHLLPSLLILLIILPSSYHVSVLNSARACCRRQGDLTLRLEAGTLAPAPDDSNTEADSMGQSWKFSHPSVCHLLETKQHMPRRLRRDRDSPSSVCPASFAACSQLCHFCKLLTNSLATAHVRKPVPKGIPSRNECQNH